MKNLSCSLLQAVFVLATIAAATTTYDNLAAPEAGSSVPGPGTYEALAYNSSIVIGDSDAVVGDVAPHSKPNSLLAGASIQMTNGTPSITVAPPYKTFSLKSFWFGCDGDLDQAAVNVASQCTVTVAAFVKANGQEVDVASFTFTPPEDVVTQVPMVQAVLPSGFQNVYMVTFIENDPETIGLGIDNIAYTAST